MKRGFFRKPLLLCLVLVAALGATGVVGAHWSGTLDISGTVETGTIQVGWYQYSGGDPRPPTPNIDYVWDPTASPPEAVPGTQDIGWSSITEQTLVCNSPVVQGGPNVEHYKTYVINLYNVYPYYYVDYQLHFHNCGTLPVLVTAVDITASPELTVIWTDGEDPANLPFKLHPCEKEASSLEVWCKQKDYPTTGDPGVVPGGNYSFTVTIEYEQAQ